jgi:hypothetical protein
MQAAPFAGTRRLFVIGSGFSASMALPTLQTLFPTLMKHTDADEEDLMRVTAAVRRLYPHFAAGASEPSYPAFEEFLGLVVAAEDTPPLPPEWWKRARQSALHLLSDCLWRLTVDAEASPSMKLLRSFVERCQLGDVAITFNWDTLLERELQRQGKRVLLLGHGPDAVTVLKLHGSLSWVKLPDDAEARPDNPLVPLSKEERVYRHPDHAYSNPWNALDASPLIVPPIAAKRPAAEAFLSSLWRDAFRALWGARTISVIGYSAPPEDLQARALLTTMLWARFAGNPPSGGRYLVIDPNPAVAARYFSQINPRVEYRQTYFCSAILEELFSDSGGESEPG